jgi:hypothetical protein
MKVVAAVAVLAVAATGCKIPLPDGAIPGKTGCEVWWLEPSSPVPLSPLDWFLLGSFVPLPVCDGMFGT